MISGGSGILTYIIHTVYMHATDLHLSGVPGVLGGLPGAVAVQLAHHGGGDGVLYALVEHVTQDAAHQQDDKQHQQDDEVLVGHGTVRSVACIDNV